MALFANSNGIGPVGFALASRTDGDGVQTGSFRAIAYGQCPFTVRYGTVAQGRSPHGSIRMSPGADGQGIGPDSAVIEEILVPIAIFRLHTEIMDGSRRRIRSLGRICRQHRSAPSKSQSAKTQQGQDG